MNRRVTAAVFALAAAASAWAQAPTPADLAVETMHVSPAVDGTGLDGSTWRAWSVATPASVHERAWTPEARPDGVYNAFLPGGAAEADRVIAVERSRPDALAPDGLAGWFAVTRDVRAASPHVMPGTQLVAVPRPSGSASGAEVRLRWDAPTALGHVVGPDRGVEAWVVLRAPDGSTAYAEVARVPGDATEALVAAPSGTWRFALRPVFSGGVEARVASRASDAVTVSLARRRFELASPDRRSRTVTPPAIPRR